MGLLAWLRGALHLLGVGRRSSRPRGRRGSRGARGADDGAATAPLPSTPPPDARPGGPDPSADDANPPAQHAQQPRPSPADPADVAEQQHADVAQEIRQIYQWTREFEMDPAPVMGVGLHAPEVQRREGEGRELPPEQRPLHESSCMQAGAEWTVIRALLLQAEQLQLQAGAEWGRLQQGLQQVQLRRQELERLRGQQQDAELALALALAEREREEQRLAELALAAPTFQCLICAGELPADELFEAAACGDTCCRGCARAYIGAALRDRTMPPPCWNRPACRAPLGQADCFAVVDDAEARLYLELSGTPAQDPGFRPCIAPDCGGYDLYEERGEGTGACQCLLDPRHRWCCHCGVDTTASQHAGVDCGQYQRWRRENDTGDAAMEQLLREGLSDPDGVNRMRRCPGCRVPYLKDRACSHVVCEKKGGGCGAHFCFRCADFKAEDATSVYLHGRTCQGFKAPVPGAPPP